MAPENSGQAVMAGRSAPLRIYTFKEFASLCGVHPETLRREIARGRGPVVTRLSARRVGIREDHGRAYQDQRAVKGGAE